MNIVNMYVDGELFSRIEHFRFLTGHASLEAAIYDLLQMGLLVQRQEVDNSRVVTLNELALVNAYNHATSESKMIIMKAVEKAQRQASSCRYITRIGQDQSSDPIYLDELAAVIDGYLAANENERQRIQSCLRKSNAEYKSVRDVSVSENDQPHNQT